VHSFHPTFFHSSPHRTFLRPAPQAWPVPRVGGALSRCRMLESYIDSFS